jgi:hypothetical protein
MSKESRSVLPIGDRVRTWARVMLCSPKPNLGRIPLPRQRSKPQGTKKGKKGYDRKRQPKPTHHSAQNGVGGCIDV